jgi:hypothetical protein
MMGRYGNLLPSQAQAVYQAIQQRSLDVSGFQWQWLAGEVIGSQATEIPALVVREEPTFFVGFALDVDGRHQIGYCPGLDVPLNVFVSLDWPRALRHVGQWLNNLTRELAADDPWAALAQQGRVLSPPVGLLGDNSPFDSAEQQRIIELLSSKLDEILRTQRLTTEQVAYLRAQVAYLTDAVKRLGRRDWWGIAAGTLFQIGLAAMFAPDARQTILSGLVQALHGALVIARLLGAP